MTSGSRGLLTSGLQGRYGTVTRYYPYGRSMLRAETGRPHRTMADTQAAHDRSGLPSAQDHVLLGQQERY